MSKTSDHHIEQVIYRICRLPAVFRAIGTKSFLTLVEESGYLQVHDQIDRVKISNHLRCYPQLIQDWLTYSVDKRVSSGWYVLDHLVGYLEEGGSRTKERSYTDPADACAEFIVNELTEMISW